MEEPPFGRQVRERRRALDLTQEELARRVACAAITVRKIEADAMRPSQQVAERLAVALAIPPEARAAFVRAARRVAEGDEPAPTPRTALLAPEEIGQADLSGRAVRGYQLSERLGAGGFGAVYRAVQPAIEREVAVKIILPQHADQPDFIRRFEAEAQLVARLEHPHIVPLYDYWREPGVAYLVMRYLRGGSLHAMLQAGPPPLEQTARIVAQLGAALQAAHRAGIVHRDLKPANVLLDEEGNAYLADFGIAKDVARPAELSFAGAFLGSPAYSSPEQIRAEAVSAQTDIYALGILLFELLTGRRPFPGPTPASYLQQHLSAAVPPLEGARPGLPAALDQTIQRATAKVPTARFAAVDELVAEVRAAIGEGRARPAPRAAPPQPAPPTLVLDLGAADSPFVGLRPFGEADAATFFGREALVQQLLGRLGEGGELARFLAVIGPSGSGKSSVVRAGLVPALRSGGLPGSEHWYVVDLLPGARPFEELAAALARVAPAGVDAETLAALLRSDHKGLLRAAGLVLPADRATELLLVFDQFEELFTLTGDEAARGLLLDSLVTAVLDERSRVRVVITLRADMLDRPLRSVDFGELIRQRSELVLPLTPDELEAAIVGPARRAGLRLEDGLVASLVADVGDQPGGLPLLQHALGELYERREGRLLTRAAYGAIGGVGGALARSAEAVYGALKADEQAAARLLFLRLVAPGEGADDARRRARLVELSAPALAVAERFAAARLLTLDREPASRAPTVEVAHEALLREWPRLRGWLDAARDDLRTQRRLALEAAEWERAGREPDFLAGGSRLAQYEALAEGSSVELAPAELGFVAASRDERVRQAAVEGERQARELAQARAAAEAQRSAAGRLRLLVGALALFLLAAAALSAFALGQQRAAEEQARLASVRAWSAAALNNLASDPERSLLLSLRAVTETHSLDGTALPEAEDALRRALQAAKLKRRLEVEGVSYGMDWSADGRYIAVQSYRPGSPKVLTLWDRDLTTELFSTTASTFGTWARFSPDGSLLAVHGDLFAFDPATGEDMAAPRELPTQLYELPSGRLRFELPLLMPTFSPDGRRLIGFPAPFAPSGNERFVTYDVATGQLLHETETPLLIEDTGYAVFSPDGERCAEVLRTNDLAIFDTATGAELYRLANPYPSSRASAVAFAPDRRWLAVGWLNGAVQLYATEEEDAVRLVQTLAAGEVDINAVAFSPDSARLAAGSRDRAITVWDVATGRRQLTLAGHSASVQFLVFSPDDDELISGDESGGVRVWDLFPGRELERSFAPATEFALSPSRTRIAGVGSDERGRIWELGGAGKPVELAGHEQFVEVAAWSDDERLVATGADDNTARVWDAASGEQLALMEGHSEWIFSVDMSPDAGRLATGSADNSARIWDARTGRELLRLEQPDTPNVVRFSADGKRLFAGLSQLGDVLVWDTTTGLLLATWKGHRSSIFEMIVSPDGSRLVTAGRDGEARVWDTTSGAELLVLRGHTGDIFGLDLSPDGRFITTASGDATARVWDAASGELLRVIPTGEGAVSAAFTADGNQLVVSTAAGSVTMFTLDLAELVALGQARLTRGWTPEECRQYLQLEQC